MPGTGDTQMNTQHPCPPGAHILKGETDSQQVNSQQVNKGNFRVDGPIRSLGLPGLYTGWMGNSKTSEEGISWGAGAERLGGSELASGERAVQGLAG